MLNPEIGFVRNVRNGSVLNEEKAKFAGSVKWIV